MKYCLTFNFKQAISCVFSATFCEICGKPVIGGSVIGGSVIGGSVIGNTDVPNTEIV